MVVRRTIENLRERPKDERTAIAASIAIGVVAILFVAWVIYFFHEVATTPSPNFQSADNSLNSGGLQQAQQQIQQAYGSTTQFVDEQGSLQIQEIGTSTESQ